jgi:hypothetical protein
MLPARPFLQRCFSRFETYRNRLFDQGKRIIAARNRLGGGPGACRANIGKVAAPENATTSVRIGSGGAGFQFPQGYPADHVLPFGLGKALPAFDFLPAAQATRAKAALLVNLADIDTG